MNNELLKLLIAHIEAVEPLYIRKSSPLGKVIEKMIELGYYQCKGWPKFE